MTAARELRFCRALYAGEAVDEALQRFAAFATFGRDQDDADWIVSVDPAREDAAHLRRLCGELQNFALGLSIRRGAPDEASP